MFLCTDAGRSGPFEIILGRQRAGDLDTIRRAADAGVNRIIARPYTGTRLSGLDVAEWAPGFARN